MIYAVTAVLGQLGREIATKLVDKLGEAQLVGLARTPDHAKSLGIEVRPGDYDEPGDLRASLQGVDALVLVSGMAPPEDRIGQHRNVIEAAKAAGLGTGKCGYTTRSELAHAYTALVTQDDLNGQTVDLNGTPITQAQLAGYLNTAFGADLTYREMSSEDFVSDRTAELGEFIGPIIGGIYDGIRLGTYDRPGDFELVTGRPHQSWDAYFKALSR